jgi:hypothetical protein
LVLPGLLEVCTKGLNFLCWSSVGIQAIGKRNGEHTIALSAVLLKPANYAKKITFFTLDIIDLVLERV